MPERRRYRSPQRDEQAESTRRRIFEAAASVFVEHGFSGATMRAVAQRAEVSVERVYIEGTKAHLLVQAFRLRYTGEYDWESILGSQWAQEMFAITDAERALEVSVDWLASAHARSAHLWLILRSTALSEPMVSEELESLLAFKRASFLRTIEWLVGVGVLPAGTPASSLPALAAANNVITSAETYIQLRDDWQMTDADYRSWLRHATTQAASLAGLDHTGAELGTTRG